MQESTRKRKIEDETMNTMDWVIEMRITGETNRRLMIAVVQYIVKAAVIAATFESS